MGRYHHREGLTPAAEGLGPRTYKMYRPSTTWTWAFLITVLVQAAIVLAMESYVFAKFQLSLNPDMDPTGQVKTIPTYLTLFIFGFIYQLLLVYDSLRLKNTIQVIGLCIYNLGMLIYAAVQVDQIKKSVYALQDKNFIMSAEQLWSDVRPYLVAAPCILALGTVAMSFVAWKLYDEFAWTIYKHISADLRMKQRFLTFQIYIALLKFDFFFFLGFTVQFLVIVTNTNQVEFYLTIAAIPITILILLMAGYWTRRENVVGMVLIILLYLAGAAYFIFKLVRIYQPGHSDDYSSVRISLTIFGVLTLILIILTIVNASVCMANFGKGLKPFILKRKIGTEEEEKSDFRMNDLPDAKHGQIPSRMTID